MGKFSKAIHWKINEIWNNSSRRSKANTSPEEKLVIVVWGKVGRLMWKGIKNKPETNYIKTAKWEGWFTSLKASIILMLNAQIWRTFQDSRNKYKITG